MKGETSFNNEFGENESKTKTNRSRALREQRNECIADRYYFMGHFTDKRYEIIMELLVTEFFLSQTTLADIIHQQGIYISNLKRNKPGVYYFQCKWPHLKWKG